MTLSTLVIRPDGPTLAFSHWSMSTMVTSRRWFQEKDGLRYLLGLGLSHLNTLERSTQISCAWSSILNFTSADVNQV